jgi:hypothetical protein
VDFLRNQRLPDVRIETSYRASGLSVRSSFELAASRLGRRHRNLGFGDAHRQVFTNDYPTWSLGVR